MHVREGVVYLFSIHIYTSSSAIVYYYNYIINNILFTQSLGLGDTERIILHNIF